MKAKLLKFCRDLRRASISTVSVAETIEAMKALSHIRITDMEEFKITLRSLLIKNSDDFQIFDTLFSIYFLNQKDKEVDEQEEEEKLKKLQEELQKNEEEFLKEFEEMDNLSEEITEQHSDSDEEQSHAEDSDSNHKHNDLQSQRFDDTSQFEERFENFGSNSKSQEPFQEPFQDSQEQQSGSQSSGSQQSESGNSESGNSKQSGSQSQSLSNLNLSRTTKAEMRELARSVDIDDVHLSTNIRNIRNAIEREIEYQMHEKLHSSGYFDLVRKEQERIDALQEKQSEASQKANEKLNEFRNELRKRIREKLEREAIEKFREQYLQELSKENISEKDFSEFSEQDIEKARKIVKKLARKIKTKASRRWKQARKDRIDIRKTIRSNIQHSALINLKFKTKKKQKLKRLITVCDVSGSCEFISGFFLTITSAMQKQFRDTKTYFFIEDVVEVDDFEKGIRSAYDVCEEGYSHIDDAMYSLSCQDLDRDDVVVILSDFRNNGREDDGTEYLQEIQKKVHRVLLFNPESREEWGSGDSEALTYKEIADMYPVNNLRSLSNAIELI